MLEKKSPGAQRAPLVVCALTEQQLGQIQPDANKTVTARAQAFKLLLPAESACVVASLQLKVAQWRVVRRSEAGEL